MFPIVLVTEYYMMPSQYKMDDYTRCMIEDDAALWCATYSIIKPNRSNHIWNIIEKYSNDTKRHNRHDLLQTGMKLLRLWRILVLIDTNSLTGVCIKWCLNRLKQYDNETLASLYVEPFDFRDQVSSIF